MSEVAADWHELMTQRHIMRTSIVCASKELSERNKFHFDT